MLRANSHRLPTQLHARTAHMGLADQSTLTPPEHTKLVEDHSTQSLGDPSDAEEQSNNLSPSALQQTQLWWHQPHGPPALASCHGPGDSCGSGLLAGSCKSRLPASPRAKLTFVQLSLKPSPAPGHVPQAQALVHLNARAASEAPCYGPTPAGCDSAPCQGSPMSPTWLP